MSAPNWPADGQTFQNGENGNFISAGDPMMTFLQPTTSGFDFNSPQTQRLQQSMQNGNAINGSPASLNAMYQTQSTIPSKRPRPREDSVSGSPQSYPGTLPVSRSQTPHSSYSGFQAPVNGASFQGNPSYQNIHHNPSATSLSPSMQNQKFSAPNPQQSPFSPPVQNLGNQVSPPHSEAGSRVNTPQNSGANYQHGTPYGMGANQPYSSHAGPTINGAVHPQYNQHPQHDQMIMEARMRQVNQMAAMRGTAQPQGVPFTPSVQLPNQMSNVQIQQMRAQQAQQSGPRQHQFHENVMKMMENFARQRGLPLNRSPTIAGKVQSSIQLFLGVVKLGGSKNMTMSNYWPRVGQLLGYPPQLQMTAAQELQNFWQTHLADFEVYYTQHHQQHMQLQQRQKAEVEHIRTGNSMPPVDQNARPISFSPTRPMSEHGTVPMQPPSSLHGAFQSPPKHMVGAQVNGRGALSNGYVDTIRGGSQTLLADVNSRLPPGMPQDLVHDAPQQRSDDVPKQAKAKSSPRSDPTRPEHWLPRRNPLPKMYAPFVSYLELVPLQNRKTGSEQGDSAEDKKKKTRLTRHGGQPVKDPKFQQSLDSMLKYKLGAPLLEELGPIDIRALTLSLRSGIRGEVRHALDTLASLSAKRHSLSLDQCEDLVETMIECATDQVELLAEHASEVSDAMMINSYQDTVRGCRMELDEIQEPTKFGTLEHDLKTAVDRLICVTTILRNFALDEASYRALSDPIVLKMLAAVIRHLGTRNMMLRSHQNALDFSKDVVVFLSEISDRLDFQSKEEALCILHFLLSFSPLPEPRPSDDQVLSFSTYTPSLNRYLPHAVDALAKLLTRETNRSFCRALFSSDVNASPSYDLLTRAFGLAISPIPEDNLTSTTATTITHRIPFMTQGLLAAEILVGMIPSADHHLALSWLNSQDRFVSRLLRTLGKLSHTPPDHVREYAQPLQPEIRDPYGHLMVTHHGLAVLRKLVERAKDGAVDGQLLPNGAFPNVHTVVCALGNERTDVEILKQLCLLQDLDR